MLRRKRYLLMVLGVVMSFFNAETGRAEFGRDELAIRSRGGDLHEFTVEVARSPETRARGLMFRRELAWDHGMLFLYPRVDDHTMWMKNTYIPLDMLFIDREGTIVHIAERTVPQSLQPISSGQPVKAVLELRGGASERLGLSEGDIVLHDAFGAAAD